MTLEDRLQGEWRCCLEGQDRENAWSIKIRGRRCHFEGITGTLTFANNEAALRLGDGDRLIINRERLPREDNLPVVREREIPTLIENYPDTMKRAWMFRPPHR
jgi:hypothetical protein